MQNKRIAIVTGGAMGIGEAIAKKFVSEDINVYLFDINDLVFEVANKLNTDNVFAKALKVDLTDTESMRKAVATVKKEVGRVDILVNNAGVVYLGDSYELSEKDWDITIDVNLKAPFILSQEVSKIMLENKKGGKIVNIASKAGVVGINQHVAYCASKFGIIGITKVFAIELSKFNIQVNSISPTVILTELGKKAWSGERRDNMLKTIPLGRFGYPEEVAAAAFFLVSEEASLICGENLVMDGGYTIQ